MVNILTVEIVTVQSNRNSAASFPEQRIYITTMRIMKSTYCSLVAAEGVREDMICCCNVRQNYFVCGISNGVISGKLQSCPEGKVFNKATPELEACVPASSQQNLTCENWIDIAEEKGKFINLSRICPIFLDLLLCKTTLYTPAIFALQPLFFMACTCFNPVFAHHSIYRFYRMRYFLWQRGAY